MKFTSMRVRQTGLRGLIASVLAAGLVAAGASSGWSDTITINPTGGGTGAGAVSGISGFTYATSSALAYGLAAPAVGATYDILYESVVSGTTGNALAVGSGYNLNNSGSEFTVIAGFQETISAIHLVPFGGPGGAAPDEVVINFSLTSSAGSPNFFDMYANTPGTVNPSTGAGTGFSAGTLILSGTLIPSSFSGSFAEAGVISGGGATFTPEVKPINGSGQPTVITTGSSVVGGGGTQLSVQVNSYNSGYFPQNPGTLLFSTTNSLPYASVAPLSGFYSTPGLGSPDITWGSGAGQFSLGTVNGEPTGGNSLMFQSVATSGFSIVPEPPSIVLAMTAAMVGLPLLLIFKKRRSSKAAAA
jgi:hypothetical protein